MKRITFLVLFFCFLNKGFSQKINPRISSLEKIPQENIFIHYNTTFLLSGEQLLYKVYCLNSKTKKLTKLSKVAYVELIDSKLKVHFRHKILLNSGLGQGDFFIPTSMKSGSYKLIAYTQWMRNGSKNNYFQGDISILNPFSDNSEILKREDVITSHKVEKKDSENTIDNLNLSLNKKVFTKREKVTLKINANKIKDFVGNYSISVRKVDGYNEAKKNTSKTYQALFNRENLFLSSLNFKYIPEFRGELISGKIIDKVSKKIVPNINVSISIPGKDYIFKVSKTNKKGIFNFNIDKTYNSSDATIEIDDSNRESYQIIVDKKDSIDYRGVNFSNFRLLKKDKNAIEQRIIHNQIENAYNTIKQDSLIKYSTTNRFFGSNVDTYVLDDYKRFPTLKETLTEITGHIYYSRKGSNYEIKVLGANFFFRNKKALILIDGVQILNHNEIIDLKTKRVKKISVLRDNYMYGIETYNGVIILETFKGDYKNLVSKDYQKNIELFKPLVPKKHFFQKYDSNKLDRIPDYRYQLFWKQNLNLSKTPNSIDFYTSDVVGIYQVDIEGFTNKGKPISLKTIFQVK